MPSPMDRYRADLQREGFVEDSAQREAVAELDEL